MFPEVKITEKERRKIIAKVTEIAVRILWEKFSYKFGGKNYHQKSGGPIGVRATGAASQLVMEHWAGKYKEILENSGIWVAMMGGYVDDGCQITTILEKVTGLRKQTIPLFSHRKVTKRILRRKGMGNPETSLWGGYA